MSINQIINPIKKLDIVCNSVNSNSTETENLSVITGFVNYLSTASFKDVRNKIQYQVSMLEAGITAEFGYQDPFLVNKITQYINDGNSNNFTRNESIYFVVPTLPASPFGLYTIDLYKEANEIPIFLDATITKTSPPGAQKGTLSVINPNTIRITFNYGSVQTPQPSSTTSIQISFLTTP